MAKKVDQVAEVEETPKRPQRDYDSQSYYQKYCKQIQQMATEDPSFMVYLELNNKVDYLDYGSQLQFNHWFRDKMQKRT